MPPPYLFPVLGTDPLPDETLDDYPKNNYCMVRGRLIGPAGLSLIGISVRAYEEGFRQKNLLASTLSNENGSFVLKLARADMGKTQAMERSSIRIEAVSGSNVLVSSINYFDFPPEINVNLQVPAGAPLPPSEAEFNVRTDVLTQLTGSTPIREVINIGSENETFFLSGATGQDVSDLMTVVDANKYAGSSSWIDAQYYYALAKAGISTEQTALDNLRLDVIEQVLTEANANGIINVTQAQINTVMIRFRDEQVFNTLDIRIEPEDVYLDDFNHSVWFDFNMYAFIFEYQISPFDSIQEFWEDFRFNWGDPLAERYQSFWQLVGITGYQPEMTFNLMFDIIYYHEIQEFAKMSQIDWVDYINLVGGSWLVPNSLYDPSDPGGSVIKYAQRLKDAFGNIYPATAIAGKLETPEGVLIIPNPALRTDVTTFINNNPLYDFRYNNAHEIAEDGFDVGGVGNVDELQTELASLQVIARITEARPDAIAALKSAGLSSTRDIVDTYTSEEFVL